MKKKIALEKHPLWHFLYKIHTKYLLTDGVIKKAPTAGNICPTVWGGLWCLLFDEGIISSKRLLRIATGLSFLGYMLFGAIILYGTEVVPGIKDLFMMGFYGIVGILVTPLFYEKAIEDKDLSRGFFARLILIASPALGYIYTMIVVVLIALAIALMVICIVIVVILGILALIALIFGGLRKWDTIMQKIIRIFEAIWTLICIAILLGVVAFLGYGVWGMENTHPGFWGEYLWLCFLATVALFSAIGILTYILYKLDTCKLKQYIVSVLKAWYQKLCPKYKLREKA